MPAPPAALVENLARAAFDAAGLRGEHAPDLAVATAKTCGQALAMFLAQAMVLPGIPAAIDPVSGAGSTAGPGKLLPPPAGGPVAPQLRGLALANLQAAGIAGEHAPALAAVIAGAIAHGLVLLCASASVAPGIAVAGFVTTTPGRLL
ncbi:MAG: hypothetical protein JNL82_37500 [Myxococcales bacterium]|jgi:hypothetical protein|nr:hypothetical protein [Myxococcales bacterium]